MQRTLVKTADGSHSIYVEQLGEHYHSIYGAIQESKHVFIEAGLKHLLAIPNKYELSILEIGFGTGLNALLSLIESEKLAKKIKYTSVEAFPLENKLVNKLNYVDLLSTTTNSEESFLQIAFDHLHNCEWEKEIPISENFILKKIENTLQEIRFEKKFDLIYFDAFGPRVQPEMWTEELFTKLFFATKPQGCLVTYCAKGEVKRALKKVGFSVETLPGPPRKREMVRGTNFCGT